MLYLVINIQKRMERGIQTTAGDSKATNLDGVGVGRVLGFSTRIPVLALGFESRSQNSFHYCMLPLHLCSVDYMTEVVISTFLGDARRSSLWPIMITTVQDP